MERHKHLKVPLKQMFPDADVDKVKILANEPLMEIRVQLLRLRMDLGTLPFEVSNTFDYHYLPIMDKILNTLKNEGYTEIDITATHMLLMGEVTLEK